VREARVLHLNLRESYGGRRFPLETDAAPPTPPRQPSSSFAWQARQPPGKSAMPDQQGRRGPSPTEAIEWGADLIILGPSRRGGSDPAGGSVTLQVLQHAAMPGPSGSQRVKADFTMFRGRTCCGVR